MLASAVFYREALIRRAGSRDERVQSNSEMQREMEEGSGDPGAPYRHDLELAQLG